MNASQLWETTLDPNARTLLKVEIHETTEADAIFTALMGDRGFDKATPTGTWRSRRGQNLRLDALYASRVALWFNAQYYPRRPDCSHSGHCPG